MSQFCLEGQCQSRFAAANSSSLSSFLACSARSIRSEIFLLASRIAGTISISSKLSVVLEPRTRPCLSPSAFRPNASRAST